MNFLLLIYLRGGVRYPFFNGYNTAQGVLGEFVLNLLIK